MAKIKTRYVCSDCGASYPRWSGQCGECQSWNTLEERLVDSRKKKDPVQHWQHADTVDLLRLQDIVYSEADRLSSGMGELDRVLGGGLVPGSLILLGGEPGIGKSTLMLQTAFQMAEHRQQKIVYVSGEESSQQIKSRAARLNLHASEHFYLMAETDMRRVLTLLEHENPSMLVIDSIQAVYDSLLETPPGGVSQVKNTCNLLMKYAKQKGVAVWVIGHVNKDGDIAGPKVLEHMVDTVLYFEGERYRSFRMLRTIKNRFGATHEVGVFDMTVRGLEEVLNPSALFLAEFDSDNSGSAITCTLEGTRPIMVELQALTYGSYANFPKRSANGVAYQRLVQIIAVLEKRLGLNLSKSDVLINVVSGLQVEEPAADLGVAMALVSSLRNVPLNANTLFVGEVGLGGEVRSISQLERRLSEAQKLGFQQAVVPAGNLPLKAEVDLKVFGVKKVMEALKYLAPDNLRAQPTAETEPLEVAQ